MTATTKINLLDHTAVKFALDKHSGERFIELLGAQEDVSNSNYQLFFGTISIGLGVLAQFYPGKFHDIRMNIALILVAYGVIQVIITYLTWYAIHSDKIVLSKARSKSINTKMINSPGICLRSHMEKYDDMYTLTASYHTDHSKEVKVSFSCSDVICKNGEIASKQFDSKLIKLIKKLHEKVHDPLLLLYIKEAKLD